MKQVVQQQRSGRLSVTEVPAPTLQPGGLLVRTGWSLISAGTERSTVQVARKNLIGKALARPEQVRQVLRSFRESGLKSTLQKVNSRLDALTPLGYSCAGTVIAVGSEVTGFTPGDRVACAGGGYANHAEINYVPQNLCVRLPEGVDLEAAAYTTLGAVALQGIRQAAPTLGETVGVIGLGLLGLLTVQLLKANGCRVVGIDLQPERCELALELGADFADVEPPTPVSWTSVQGLDAVILTAATSSSEPIRQAAEMCRDRGRVVIVGAVGMDVPRAPFYDKEIELRIARSYGPGRYDPNYEEKGQDYPIGYVRWTEGRNMAAFLDLLAQGRVRVDRLTTHRIPIEDAEQAYDMIQDPKSEPYLGVLLEYPRIPHTAPPDAAPVRVSSSRQINGQIGLGLIGAGNFAQSFLLPPLQKLNKVYLKTVVTPSGLSARSAAEKAGFENCAAEPETVFEDPAVHLALIASRHDSHAELAIRGLQAGKAVFVEKPLALTPDELETIEAAYGPESFLMVGFNRRFAPLYQKLRAFFDPGELLMMQYRVNAGYIPKDHWTQDLQVGGGRVIGEVCHFVDLMAHLTGRRITELHAFVLPDQERYNGDNLSALLRFEDGSVGTLTYAANGDRGLPKERLEVLGGGKAAVLEDFKELALYSGGRRKTEKTGQDKGHTAEMRALVEAVADGSEEPVPFEESVHATRATFAILESLRTGEPVKLG